MRDIPGVHNRENIYICTKKVIKMEKIYIKESKYIAE